MFVCTLSYIACLWWIDQFNQNQKYKFCHLLYSHSKPVWLLKNMVTKLLWRSLIKLKFLKISISSFMSSRKKKWTGLEWHERTFSFSGWTIPLRIWGLFLLGLVIIWPFPSIMLWLTDTHSNLPPSKTFYSFIDLFFELLATSLFASLFICINLYQINV